MKIGKIISVEYDKFRVRLFQSNKTSTVSIEGRVYYFGNIGSYLKTMNSSSETILCEVVSIVDWVNGDNNVYNSYNLDSSREIIIKPIGTLRNNDFSMGVGIFPSLYNDVEIVTYEDLDKILSSNKETVALDGIHKSINIGISKSLINYKIDVDINRLFNIHTAVLGNSGSGKSNTIAHILQNIYRKENNIAQGAKTIIFDANGEYPSAFRCDKRLNVKPVFYKPNIKSSDGENYKPFYLPYYLMNLDEWLSFLMASERTQKPFWDRVLQECFKFYKIFNTKKKTDAAVFVNYLKWKLSNMLFNIVSRIDSDTSKMTAAKGAIAKIRNVCENEQLGERLDDEVKSDLIDFLNICDSLCHISYGNNYDALSNALGKFYQTDETPKYVYTEFEKGVQVAGTSRTPKVDSFRQINVESAITVDQTKLKSGEYFDYQFLQTAVDIVLTEEESRGNLHIRDFVSTLVSRLDFFLYNDECDFMRDNTIIFADYNDYLQKVFGISSSDIIEKQLITIDASEVGTDVFELMTNVVSRLLFDYRKTKIGKGRTQNPIHLILDEAHRYIKKDADYIMRENIFEKIAREGRKYSLYLLVSSQRPSELSQTVLSQCGNYIVHRIQNEVDMRYIYSVLPYFSDDYTAKIKQAVPGEALVFGNCVPMPLMVKVEKAEPSPNSGNCNISKEWFRSRNSDLDFE